MLIFIILYGIILGIVRSTVSGLIVNSSSIYSILALCIFIAILLMFTHNPKVMHWATIGLFAIILCYVACNVIASYPNEVVRTITLVMSAFATVFIKRPMWHFISIDERRAASGGVSYISSNWLRWIIRLI